MSNYDESKVGRYTLPDPLVFADGKPVRDAAAWKRRRAEILRLYETGNLRPYSREHAKGHLARGRNRSEGA